MEKMEFDWKMQVTERNMLTNFISFYFVKQECGMKK